MENNFKLVKKASLELSNISEQLKNDALMSLADKLVENSGAILSENRKDLEIMGEDNPKYDRLLLSLDRIEAIANDIRNVVKLDSPLNKLVSQTIRPNGLLVEKVTVPFGVVGFIYEARPNVTIDAFALCFKSSNATILKGGSDAWHTNTAILKIIQKNLEEHSINKDVVHLMPPDRESVYTLLNAVEYVDICIPRGSKNLIDFVRDNAKVPVIETGAGVVHTYVHKDANINMAEAIVTNSKTRRVSVCNALDTLVLHKNLINKLTTITKKLASHDVEIFADKESFEALEGHYPKNLLKKATEENFGAEFLDYKLSIKVVDSLDSAIEFIQNKSSKHSEAIVTEDRDTGEKFIRNIDAAVVYVNSPTSFTDGGEFGLGAEIGVSTQKLHARGPMALEALVSTKWIVHGNGQVRP